MLTPEYLQRAGELVGAVYTAMEAEMLAHLVSMMVEGKPVTERSSIEVLLLAQSQTETLRRICERYGPMINESLRLTVEDALHRVSEGLVGGTGDLPQQIELTTSGIAEILARDNLDMVEDAKDLFIQESTRAITFTNAGVLTGEEAIRRAVRELEGKGLGIVTYRATKKGMQGVRNKVDVAVKRHVRTQIAQDGARFMLERLEALDVALVEVSSHADSRPEHAGWQGQCYSLHGTVEIDGTVYPDFYEATGYGTVTGLCGANCRHHFGPYAHGMPRAYEPNPEHPSGLPGEEVYELEQNQRLAERRIREAKREVQGAQILYDERPELDNLTNLNRAKAKVRERQAQMRDLIQDANEKSVTGTRVLTRNYTREWVGEGGRDRMAQMTKHFEKGINAKKRVNRTAKVDLDYIKSEKYRKKFDGLTSDPKIDNAIYEAAKATLTHRNGTDSEDLWLVSRSDPEKKLKIAGGSLEVRPTKRLIKALVQAPPETYIGIHNHPTNIPPTGSDLAAAAARKYAFGIVALHDGRVYYYRPVAPIISARYVDAMIDKYIKRGYNKTQSAINALDELAKEGEIIWRELK